MLTEAPKVTASPSAVSGKACSKCGVSKKSGKQSCCAPGGAWYKNCADEVDANVDHTWADGIQACKDFENLLLGKNQAQTIRHGPTPRNVSDALEPNSLLLNFAIFVDLLFVILQMSM